MAAIACKSFIVANYYKSMTLLGESSILPLTTPPQTESSFLTTTYENIPSSTAPSSHTVFPSYTTTNHPSPPFTSTASQMLPMQSNSPTFQTSGDVDDHDLSQMELILGLVALGVLLLVSATLLLTVTTVCVCRQVIVLLGSRHLIDIGTTYVFLQEYAY